jgi:hypothetical protein
MATHIFHNIWSVAITNEGGTNDMMVGIGLYTKYGSDHKYNYGNYWYTQQAGYGYSKTVSFVQPIIPKMMSFLFHCFQLGAVAVHR